MHYSIQLIVGLGNPGIEYEHTRHNAGVWFLHNVAHTANVSLRQETRFQGYHAIANLQNRPCHLLVPTTFMNHSGQAVSALANYYKIAPAAILVVHDEIDLPVGSIKLKWDGGHSGHNGLRNIIAHLHTQQFYRLRVGVGRPAHSKEVHDYVLSSPSKMEREQIETSLQQGQAILPLVLRGECQKAMQQLHTK